MGAGIKQGMLLTYGVLDMECFVEIGVRPIRVWNSELQRHENVYKTVRYPACKTSALLAELSGNAEELTPETLAIAKKLGYDCITTFTEKKEIDYD